MKKNIPMLSAFECGCLVGKFTHFSYSFYMEEETSQDKWSNIQAMFPILAACLGSSLVGASAIFVRLSDLGPITTAFYRILFALPLLAIWMIWEQKQGYLLSKVPQKDYLGLTAAGLFFALDLALWYWSIDYTTIVNASLFNNTAAFFVPIITWVLYKERQSSIFFLAVLVCFIGCSCLMADSLTMSITNIWGDAVALLSGFAVALYLIALKRVREDISTGYLMFWTALSSVIFLLAFALLAGEYFWPMTFKDFISIFGQAILVHVIGQGLLAFSLGKVPANYVALILFLAPATAGVLGWVVYGESLGVLKLAGIALIVVSILSIRKKV